ncbi:hypothetical protein ACQP3D_31025, partial [Escherichia coli]
PITWKKFGIYSSTSKMHLELFPDRNYLEINILGWVTKKNPGNKPVLELKASAEGMWKGIQF